ncbi:hypothetical protein BQ8794_240238 [Mesorhizobium prunaredense]|uniref:Uncharacterized protein n=1 Tax=Mesorhizobium prunaredense TaxID=1631249 RepID=A0A1R3V9U8_9HYPH|nr:hypothetical protein BQ8794_240238 [Mesorhizobium prunaredense]
MVPIISVHPGLLAPRSKSGIHRLCLGGMTKRSAFAWMSRVLVPHNSQHQRLHPWRHHRRATQATRDDLDWQLAAHQPRRTASSR